MMINGKVIFNHHFEVILMLWWFFVLLELLRYH